MLPNTKLRSTALSDLVHAGRRGRDGIQIPLFVELHRMQLVDDLQVLPRLDEREIGFAGEQFRKLQRVRDVQHPGPFRFRQADRGKGGLQDVAIGFETDR